MGHKQTYDIAQNLTTQQFKKNKQQNYVQMYNYKDLHIFSKTVEGSDTMYFNM